MAGLAPSDLLGAIHTGRVAQGYEKGTYFKGFLKAIGFAQML
jgi:hypothetical protein